MIEEMCSCGATFRAESSRLAEMLEASSWRKEHVCTKRGTLTITGKSEQGDWTMGPLPGAIGDPGDEP